MIRIALAGNIASGKSTVQSILTNLGYRVFDTDDAAHELLTVKNKELCDFFQDYDVLENGEFSREKVAQLIFTNSKLKKDFENIIHPQIKEKIEQFFKDYKSEKLLFVAIPLLFEVKMEYLFDKIVFVYCDDKIRLQRLITRNGYTLEYAKMRLSCQESQERKVKKSDFVINNNSSTADLKEQVTKLLYQVCGM